jgi:hypothetical protein
MHSKAVNGRTRSHQKEEKNKKCRGILLEVTISTRCNFEIRISVAVDFSADADLTTAASSHALAAATGRSLKAGDIPQSGRSRQFCTTI